MEVSEGCRERIEVGLRPTLKAFTNENEKKKDCVMCGYKGIGAAYKP